MSNDEQVMNFIRDQFEQVNNRLDQHFELFSQHVKDDKALAEHIAQVDKEVTFAKGVAYVLSGGTALMAGLTGWWKHGP